MSERKTKAIKNLEQKMEEMTPDSLRYKVLQSAKGFKTSWIELGQILYTVWKDKLYKDWGYSEFDTFTLKEIGVQKQTALKLLRSYSFLENSEPRYLKKDYAEDAGAAQVPTYEAVDVLRRASNNKDIGEVDYSRIKKYVLEDGKGARDVQKDLTKIIRNNEQLEPEEMYQKKRLQRLRRFLSLLKSIKEEIRTSDDLPARISIQADKLIGMIEGEVG
ncbi:hypothetical protein ACFL5Y_02250 [Candidatus Omnitrophota bacterium]